MRNILLLFVFLLAAGAPVLAKKPTLTPVFDLNAHYDYGLGVDKNYKACPVVVDVSGSTVTFSILGEGFEVVKSFSIKDINLDSDKCITGLNLSFNSNFSACYEDYAYAIQGLLDDEDKWVVAFERYTRNYEWYSEDGEKILEWEGNYSDDYHPIYVFDKWYVGWYVCNDIDMIMTFRSNEAGSEIVRVSYVVRSRVYPNPARKSDVVKVELAEPAGSDTKLELTDMSGRVVNVVNAVEGESSISFNASRLRSGTYVYSVISGGYGIEQGKIIIR